MASKKTGGNCKQSKHSSNQLSVLCPVCEELIVDGDEKTPGHDSIECEGLCKAWLHSGCAGLSKTAFEVAASSPDPFFVLTLQVS